MNDNPIARQPVVLALPGMRGVVVLAGLPYATGSGATLGMDLHLPPGRIDGPLPAVVFVSGYGDSGALDVFGCRLKDMAAYTSWARLVAARGMAPITYEAGLPSAYDERRAGAASPRLFF